MVQDTNSFFFLFLCLLWIGEGGWVGVYLFDKVHNFVKPWNEVKSYAKYTRIHILYVALRVASTAKCRLLGMYVCDIVVWCAVAMHGGVGACVDVTVILNCHYILCYKIFSIIFLKGCVYFSEYFNCICFLYQLCCVWACVWYSFSIALFKY